MKSYKQFSKEIAFEDGMKNWLLFWMENLYLKKKCTNLKMQKGAKEKKINNKEKFCMHGKSELLNQSIRP